jgi:hypothetical protein
MFPNPEAQLQDRRESEAQRQRAAEAHARELALPNPYSRRLLSELAQALKALQKEQSFPARFASPAGRILAGAVEQGFLREHPTFAATVEPTLQWSYGDFYLDACVFLARHATDFGELADGVAVSTPGGMYVAGTNMIIRLLETAKCNIGVVPVSKMQERLTAREVVEGNQPVAAAPAGAAKAAAPSSSITPPTAKEQKATTADNEPGAHGLALRRIAEIIAGRPGDVANGLLGKWRDRVARKNFPSPLRPGKQGGPAGLYDPFAVLRHAQEHGDLEPDADIEALKKKFSYITD